MNETASQAANKSIDAISGMPDAFTVVAVLVVVLLAVLAGFWIYLKNKPDQQKASEGGEVSQEASFIKLASAIDRNAQSTDNLAKLLETILGGQGEKLNIIIAQNEKTHQMITDHHLKTAEFIASQKE